MIALYKISYQTKEKAHKTLHSDHFIISFQGQKQGEDKIWGKRHNCMISANPVSHGTARDLHYCPLYLKVCYK